MVQTLSADTIVAREAIKSYAYHLQSAIIDFKKDIDLSVLYK